MIRWQEDVKCWFRPLLWRLCGNCSPPSPEHTLVWMQPVCSSFLWSWGYSKGSIFAPATHLCLKGDMKSAGIVLYLDPCLSPLFLHVNSCKPFSKLFSLLISFVVVFVLFRIILIWSFLILPGNLLEISGTVIFWLKGWSTTRVMKTSFPQKGFDSQQTQQKQVTTGISQSFLHYRQRDHPPLCCSNLKIRGIVRFNSHVHYSVSCIANKAMSWELQHSTSLPINFGKQGRAVVSSRPRGTWFYSL